MNDIERRTRIAAVAERLRDEETRIGQAIERETDNFRINELDFAQQAVSSAATILENLSIPESEHAIVLRQFRGSIELMEDLKKARKDNTAR